MVFKQSTTKCLSSHQIIHIYFPGNPLSWSSQVTGSANLIKIIKHLIKAPKNLKVGYFFRFFIQRKRAKRIKRNILILKITFSSRKGKHWKVCFVFWYTKYFVLSVYLQGFLKYKNYLLLLFFVRNVFNKFKVYHKVMY